MNPQFPLYIVSKGRADTRLTSKALEMMGVPYSIIIESQEYDSYAAVIDPKKILILDPKFQTDYEVMIRDSASKGSGPARNFAWEHSISQGHKWHWVMDDNIDGFRRMNKSKRLRVGDGTIFAAMENFCLRYTNIAMAGPHYYSFAMTTLTKTHRLPPFLLNTRIFSCNLIRNDVPFRWRGRYNEDLDLSLNMLKGGWCTVQFYAFLQNKARTLTMKGGNAEIYSGGTLEKSKMIVRNHPDVARLAWRYGRAHHWVDFRPFERNKLKRKPGLALPETTDDHGMRLRQTAKN